MASHCIYQEAWVNLIKVSACFHVRENFWNFFINIKQKNVLRKWIFWHGVYFKINGIEVIIISNFRSSASAFDKKIFKTTCISIIDTALALKKYTEQLLFNKAKLVQFLLIDNVGKLQYLPLIILAFYSYTRN